MGVREGWVSEYVDICRCAKLESKRRLVQVRGEVTALGHNRFTQQIECQ